MSKNTPFITNNNLKESCMYCITTHYNKPKGAYITNRIINYYNNHKVLLILFKRMRHYHLLSTNSINSIHVSNRGDNDYSGLLNLLTEPNPIIAPAKDERQKSKVEAESNY